MSDVETSKFLSFVLRHRPEAANITLDAGGWVAVDALLAGCAAAELPLSRERLEAVVAASDKRRFTIRDGMIRANQGHSVPVDLDLARVEPPEALWHGTVARFLDAILHEGLRPMRRHHVHLSANRETARQVGSRRGEPIVLRVDAAGMQADGHAFFVSENDVWLVDAVPPRHLVRE